MDHICCGSTPACDSIPIPKHPTFSTAVILPSEMAFLIYGGLWQPYLIRFLWPRPSKSCHTWQLQRLYLNCIPFLVFFIYGDLWPPYKILMTLYFGLFYILLHSLQRLSSYTHATLSQNFEFIFIVFSFSVGERTSLVGSQFICPRPVQSLLLIKPQNPNLSRQNPNHDFFFFKFNKLVDFERFLFKLYKNQPSCTAIALFKS